MKASADPTDPAFGPGPKHHICHCLLCARERRFHSIAAKLKNPSDKAWLLNFYDYVVQHEREFAKACTQRKPGHP